MSEKKDMPSSEEQDGLNLQDVKNLTIEEAVRKDSERKAGITESDGVLDKYIKQHRDEVTSQKFETKLSDFENLDTEALDNFIKKQREELVNSGIVSKEVFEEAEKAQAEPVVEDVKPSETSSEVVEETVEPAKEVSEPEVVETKEASVEEAPTDDKEVGDEIKEVEAKESSADEQVSTTVEEESKTADESIAISSDDDKTSSKKKRVIIGGLAALVVAIFGAGYGLHYAKDSSTTVASSSTTSTTKKTSASSSAAKKAKEAKEAFDDVYAALFTDDTKTKLKNSEFDKISVLKEKLDALKGTDFYDAAKKQYDTVAAHITAIKAINALFDKDVIVDGKKVSGTVKADANFDNLSSDVLNTGDAKLDNLLQSAITEGKKQLTSTQSSSQEQAASSESQTDSSEASSTESTSNTPSLQRDKSRVPYNESAIADSGNAAWTFGDGVLEKVVSTSQVRGYFSGDDYILEKVNIINGNGYYNMFRKDGTYLFSINCKTGYFVGNGSGHSDALDY